MRLRTFGGLSLEDGDPGSPGSPERAAQRPRLALLAVLAANRHRPVSRDKLLGFFWPDRDADDARHSLAQLVNGIRQELGEDVLLSGVDDLRTNPERLAADVAEFQDALDRGNLEAAVACYEGAFLDGFFLSDAPEFEHWVEAGRADLARRCGEAMETLARGATRANDHTAAAQWWRRRAALNPLDASVAMELMRALSRAGDHAGAIRHAGVHEMFVQSALDAPTDPDVAVLAKLLREAMRQEPPAAIAIVAPPQSRTR